MSCVGCGALLTKPLLLGGTVTYIKMAENQIAKEIMQHFAADEYTEYVRQLSNRDAVSMYQFNHSDMGKYYWIDIRSCFTVEQCVVRQRRGVLFRLLLALSRHMAGISNRFTHNGQMMS